MQKKAWRWKWFESISRSNRRLSASWPRLLRPDDPPSSVSAEPRGTCPAAIGSDVWQPALECTWMPRLELGLDTVPAKAVIGSSSGEPSPELRRSWTFFRFGYQTPSSSIVCLAQPVRSALFRESVITGSSTVAERFRYLLDRSELLFQISSRLFLSWHWRSDTHL
ncbi:hypothetical protein V6N12_054920 [Hibiscus sabdariffa]|uniref:Uncharacterized protein n=1 Tax=Hibiscus sabdariffa TaxID=183260 RepID=A0ABR2D1W8_9ROSI